MPDSYKNESLIEMEDYLGEMIHRIDSSLWEEWERLKNPDFQAQTEEEKLPFSFVVLKYLHYLKLNLKIK